MGFLNYSVKFFIKKLQSYESIYKNRAPESIVHEAKVLLKLLYDLRDEGYEDSYTYIDERCNAVERLNSFIYSNNDTPFVLKKDTVISKPKYSRHEYNLEEYIASLEQKMHNTDYLPTCIPDVFYDIAAYSRKLFDSSSPDIAYCFLLRDTLLPYLAFRKWNKDKLLNISYLFVSRKYFSFFETRDEEIYNAVQEVIFNALDSGAKSAGELKDYVRISLDTRLKRFVRLFDSLKGMLSNIKQQNIMIVESGYIGTIPLLFSALDSRVDFRLFTTIPYFYDCYKGKFYTNKFEKIREFETINCQDSLFKLSSVSADNKSFKVVETINIEVKNRAYAQLQAWNRMI